VFIDGEPVQAVVPADLEVDLARLAAVQGRLNETPGDHVRPCRQGAFGVVGTRIT
jgi:hypothetical protein